MSNETSATLRAALCVAAEKAEKLDPVSQRGAWSLAEKTKDISLLVALTGRNDLIAELKLKAKARKDIPIRVAYLNRDDVASSPEFMLMLKDETRAGVLSGICGEGSLSEKPVLEKLLVERMRTKPTRALSEAIISLEGAGAELYCLALAHLSSKTNFTNEQSNRLIRHASSVRENTEALSELIRNLDIQGAPETWVRDLVYGELDNETQLLYIEKCIKPMVESVLKNSSGARYQYYYTEMHLRSAVSGMLDKSLTSGVLATLLSTVQPVSGTFPAIVDSVKNYDPNKIKKESEEREQLLKDAKESNDPEKLAEIIANINRDWDVIDLLIGNENVKDECLESLVLQVSGIGNTKKTIQFLEKYKGNDNLVLLAYSADDALIDADKWQSFSDSASAKEKLLKIAASPTARMKANNRYYNRVRQVTSIIDRLDANDASLLAVPWPLVEEILSGSWTRESSAATKICSLLAEEQARVLGDDPVKWETLSVLASGFEGSIGDLMRTAATL